MPEQLSQGQIDALLKRLSTGEVDVETESRSEGRKIRDYDFKSPKKFTKEQLRALDSLHENFARLFSSYLSGLLRVYCEASVLQIEEQRYYEYSNALSDTTLIGVIDLKPKNKRLDDATLIMDVSSSLSFSMIDRLLGGSGEGNNLTREYTDIEVAILTNILEKTAGLIKEAWQNYIEIDAELRNVETNARLLQALSPDDIVVIIILSVKLKNISGEVSICLPAINLEEIISNFSSKYARATKRHFKEIEEQKKQKIMDSLTESDLEIKAVLHEMQLDLKDILQLQVADVIPLNKKINSDIYITVDNSPWFKAKLGETKIKKAVKLSGLIN